MTRMASGVCGEEQTRVRSLANENGSEARNDEPTSTHLSSVDGGRGTVGSMTAKTSKQILLVVGGFFVMFNTWGLVLAYGTLQYYYASSLLSHSSPTSIAWIGTVQSGLLILAGVPAGQLFDLGYFKITTSVGATLVTVGIFMLSLVHKDAYWQVMLTQGLTIGLGSGMLYIPVLAVVGQAFPEGSGNKRAVAMGVVTAGVGVGGIAYTLAFSRLVISHTFGSTVRDLGYIMIAGFAIIMPSLFFGSTQTSNTQLTASNTGQQRERRALFDATALRDKRFMIFTLAEFFLFIAYLIPLFFTPTFATDVLGLKEQDAADLLAISAGASSSGRLVISALVAYANLGDNPSVSILAWTACCVSAAILAFGWIGIRNDHGFIAFTVLYGFATGGIISLPPSIFPSTCCPDKKKLGTRLGMSFGVNGIAFLVGSPIGGAILGRGENDQWIGLAAFAGSIMGLGALGVGVFGVMVRKSKE